MLEDPWVSPPPDADAAPALDLATELTRWFEAEGGKDFLPDLDLVPLEEPLGGGSMGPEGFLVCRVGPGAAGAGVQEGDVVTLVDQLRVGLTAAERAALVCASCGAVRAAGGGGRCGGDGGDTGACGGLGAPGG